MLPIISLALAAVYAPTGRYGFPSGKRDLPVATVPLPVHIYMTQTSIATKQSRYNADAPGEQLWPSCGALPGGHRDVGLGTSGHRDAYDGVVQDPVVHAYWHVGVDPRNERCLRLIGIFSQIFTTYVWNYSVMSRLSYGR